MKKLVIIVFIALVPGVAALLSGCHTAQLVSASQPIVLRSPTGIEVDLSVTNLSSRPLYVGARLEAKGPTEQWSGDTPAATRAVTLRSPGTNATFHITLDGNFSVCRVRLDCREGGGWRERTYMRFCSQHNRHILGQWPWPWHRALITEELSP